MQAISVAYKKCSAKTTEFEVVANPDRLHSCDCENWERAWMGERHQT
jgi:hypothetical protein